MSYAIPMDQRGAAADYNARPRWSKTPIELDGQVLRVFTWWKNGLKPGSESNTISNHWGNSRDNQRIDIDTWMVLVYDDGHSERVGYGNPRGNVHVTFSGDVTNPGPNGGAEFFDLDMATLKSAGVKYITMNNYSFTGQRFCDMNEAFSGYMMLDDKNQFGKKKFDAKAVQLKVDLKLEGTTNMIFIIDLDSENLIYVDQAFDRAGWSGYGSDSQVTAMIFKGADLERVSLHDLFTLHVNEEDLVETPEEANTVFAVNADITEEQRLITPNELEVIMGEFLQ